MFCCISCCYSVYKDGICMRYQLLYPGSPADSGWNHMQKEVEMSSKVLQMSLSCCLGHQCQQWRKKVEKVVLPTLNFVWILLCQIGILLLYRCLFTVTLWDWVISMNQWEWSSLNYGSQCLPCLTLLNSHRGYCRQGILLCAIYTRSALIKNNNKKKKGGQYKHLFNLTLLEVNTLRLGPKLLWAAFNS